jgi:RimJ/RimL family protein N-acetyltransferase
MAEPVFSTARLVLRRWREDDREQWQAHLNTPEVRQYLAGMLDAQQAAASFARMLASWDDGRTGFLALERRADGALIGTCGIGPVFDEPAPEPLASGLQLGWQLRSDAWGRGYATEAAKVLLDYGFATLSLVTVWAQTSERNRASWAVMQRLGMTRRAELDYFDPAYPPEDNPAMVWSLDRTDWSGQ